ncbi:hypothetical protein COU59_00515 [Candidatus Pacearchaeota archaeon CG10_big_fil_rev_8_21_14_0_10_34_12]|nr:MAG: hypothetical protein COU59_00515 [Candidatus Pacearchaeota archaeon CG10_big_fil_rev_8_21_14_0_10_34_12]
MENQKEIWNEIAKPWKSFRVKPIQEVAEFLKNKKGKILDLGCGSGRHFIKNKFQEFYGVDFSEEMLKHAEAFAKKEKIDVALIKADVFKLPFKDNFFDAAIFIAALHCLETQEKRRKSLEELFRVLKRNSEVLVTVWDKNQEKFKNEKKEVIIPWKYEGKEYPRHYYLYETHEILGLLKNGGFKIVQVNNSKNPNGFNSKRNIDIIVRKP